MKSILVLCATVLAVSSASAGERVVQVFNCKNENLSAKVVVSADDKTSVATVEWTVRDAQGEVSNNMGYLFVTKGLEKFDSLDTDERLEMNGKILTLSDDSVPGSEKVLICR